MRFRVPYITSFLWIRLHCQEWRKAIKLIISWHFQCQLPFSLVVAIVIVYIWSDEFIYFSKETNISFYSFSISAGILRENEPKLFYILVLINAFSSLVITYIHYEFIYSFQFVLYIKTYTTSHRYRLHCIKCSHLRQ